MSSVPEQIYTNIIKPKIDTFTSVVCEITTDIVDVVHWGHRKITTCIDDTSLPAPYKQVIKRIISALPEVFFCAAAMTGFGLVPASLFWTYRLVTALSPAFFAVLSGNISIDALGQAAHASLNNFRENYNRLTPALALVFTISGTVNFIFGWTQCDYQAMADGVVHFAIAGLAVKDIMRSDEPTGVITRNMDDIALQL